MFFSKVCLSALIALAFLAGINPVWAEPARIVPLHIKMGSSAKKPAGIQIHKGPIPIAKLLADEKNPPRTNKANSILLRSTSPEEAIIDAQISCAMNRSTPMTVNQIQNMADSLKTYLRIKKLDDNLIDTLQRVSKETRTDFELLVVKAMLESDLGRSMKSPVSTARGVFQYIETTWLNLIHRYGDKIGYPQYAYAIEINSENGQPFIKKSSKISKEEILDLRFNPYSAAMIKALQIRDESATVKDFKDSPRLSATDHYIAHMMGLTLAEQFYALKNAESDELLAHSSNPLFREAVALNRPFFYDEKGRALNAAQAYAHFKMRIAKAYEHLHTIEARYGRGQPADSACNTMPAVPAADIEAVTLDKPEMMPSKGLSVAALDSKILPAPQ